MPVSPPHRQLVTVSFDREGRVRWAARYEDAILTPIDEGSYSHGGVRVQTDAIGNIYIAAEVRGTQGAQDHDLLVLKYDAFGMQMWATQFSIFPQASNDAYTPAAIVVDLTDNVYVCGLSIQPPGMMTVKFDPGGIFQWVDVVVSNAQPVRAAHLSPLDGSLYVATTAIHNGTYDFVLAHYTSAGQRAFVSFFDGPAHREDRLMGLGVDDQGRAYIGGETTMGSGQKDLLAFQVLPDGTVGWNARYSSSADLYGDYVYGFFLSAAQQPTFLASTFFQDTYGDAVLVQADQTGSQRWQTRLNTVTSSREYWLYDIAVADSGDVYVWLCQ